MIDKTGNQSVKRVSPGSVVSEHNVSFVFDHHSRHRRWIIVVHEPALGGAFVTVNSSLD